MNNQQPQRSTQDVDRSGRTPCSLAGQQIIDGLPDYDRFIIDAICGTLRKWIDEQRHNVVWLRSMDIDQLESWATDLAKQYRDTELSAAAMEAETLQLGGGQKGKTLNDD